MDTRPVLVGGMGFGAQVGEMMEPAPTRSGAAGCPYTRGRLPVHPQVGPGIAAAMATQKRHRQMRSALEMPGRDEQQLRTFLPYVPGLQMGRSLTCPRMNVR